MLTLPATLTEREARGALDALALALQHEPAGAVVVDASALADFDSSALAVLLECQRRAHAAGRGFGVHQPSAKLASLARLYGVEELLLPAAAG